MNGIDLFYLLACFWYLPRYVLRGKSREGFGQRLGRLPPETDFRSPIWIHAVSVGEAIAVRALLPSLRRLFPGRQLLLSTVTATGNRIAQGMRQPGDEVIYLPFDFSWTVRAVLERVRPSLVVIVETEIWPNFLKVLKERGTPVIVINARISDRSYGRYLRFRRFLRASFGRVDLFAAQTEGDRQRLISIGVDAQRVVVAGNLKFDMDIPAVDAASVRAQLGLEPSQRLLVAGSTHPGEEEFLLQAYLQLRRAFPDLRLLIAPRHPERAALVGDLVAKSGCSASFLSQAPAVSKADSGNRVWILDSVGQLIRFYAAADAVFMGGSLVPQGGHNILEPAAFARPVVFGRYMHNFRDIAELFLAEKAARQVQEPQELFSCLQWVFERPRESREMAQRGRTLIDRYRGATQRVLDIIERGIKNYSQESGVRIAQKA